MQFTPLVENVQLVPRDQNVLAVSWCLGMDLLAVLSTRIKSEVSDDRLLYLSVLRYDQSRLFTIALEHETTKREASTPLLTSTEAVGQAQLEWETGVAGQRVAVAYSKYLWVTDTVDRLLVTAGGIADSAARYQNCLTLKPTLESAAPIVSLSWVNLVNGNVKKQSRKPSSYMPELPGWHEIAHENAHSQCELRSLLLVADAQNNIRFLANGWINVGMCSSTPDSTYVQKIVASFDENDLLSVFSIKHDKTENTLKVSSHQTAALSSKQLFHKLFTTMMSLSDLARYVKHKFDSGVCKLMLDKKALFETFLFDGTVDESDWLDLLISGNCSDSLHDSLGRLNVPKKRRELVEFMSVALLDVCQNALIPASELLLCQLTRLRGIFDWRSSSEGLQLIDELQPKLISLIETLYEFCHSIRQELETLTVFCDWLTAVMAELHPPINTDTVEPAPLPMEDKAKQVLKFIQTSLTAPSLNRFFRKAPVDSRKSLVDLMDAIHHDVYENLEPYLRTSTLSESITSLPEVTIASAVSEINDMHQLDARVNSDGSVLVSYYADDQQLHLHRITPSDHKESTLSGIYGLMDLQFYDDATVFALLRNADMSESVAVISIDENLAYQEGNTHEVSPATKRNPVESSIKRLRVEAGRRMCAVVSKDLRKLTMLELDDDDDE